MSKTIFRAYAEVDFILTGKSYTVLITDDDDFKPIYPYTDIPIPTDLQTPDKVPFFDPTQGWVDKSTQANIAAAKKQADDLAAAKQDAADAKANAEALQKALDQANADIELGNQATTELTNILFSVADQDKLAAAMGMTETTQEATTNA